MSLRLDRPSPRARVAWCWPRVLLALGWLLGAAFAAERAGAQGLDDDDPATTYTQATADAWTSVAQQVVLALETTDTQSLTALFEPFLQAQTDLDGAFGRAYDRVLLGYNSGAAPTGSDAVIQQATEAESTMMLLAPMYFQWIETPQAEVQTNLLEALREALPIVAELAPRYDAVLAELALKPLPAGLQVQVNAPEQARRGEPVSVRMRVYNAGDAPAEGVQLFLVHGIDTNQEEETIEAGTLAPGAELIHLFYVDLFAESPKVAIVYVGARAKDCLEEIDVRTIDLLETQP